jgi:hypothetical protein
MTLFDDFIANNASEDQMWQIVKDFDLYEKRGGIIGDCVMRNFANQFIDTYDAFKDDSVTYVMREFYLVCCKHFAHKYKKESAEYKFQMTVLQLTLESIRDKLTEAGY